MTYRLRRAAFLMSFVGFVWAPESVSAHKFYASLAQIERTEDGRLEVGIRFFPDDLELALSNAAGRRIVVSESTQFRDALLKYIGPNLVIESGADRATFRYVGVDPKVNVLWVFLEADWSRPLKGARLTNRLLQDISSDQVNTVNLTEGSAKETLTFMSDRTTAVAFAPRE